MARRLLCGLGLVAVAGAAAVTPVESVIKLLEKLQKQTEEEGKKEAKGYDKFACFCKEQSDGKLYAITKATEKIGLLTAEVKELGADIAQLNDEVVDMTAQAEEIEKKLEESKQERTKQHSEYVLLKTDLQAAIDGAGEAVELLKSQKAPGSLIQQKVATVMQLGMSEPAKPSKDEVKLIMSFLEQDPKASEFHSDEVVQQMMDMEKKFKGHANDLDAEEATTKHEYDMKTNARQNQLRALQDSIKEAEETASQKEEEKNSNQEDLTKTTADKAADQTFLDELTMDCEEKATAWDQRSQKRSGELAALAKALEVMKGVAGGKKAAALVSQKAKKSAAAHWVWVEDSTEAATAKTAADKKAAVDDADVDAQAADLDDEGDDEPENGADDISGEDSTGASSAYDDEMEADPEAPDDLDEADPNPSFLQRRKVVKHSHAQKLQLAKQVLSFLRDQSKALKSATLSQLVFRMKEDHFVKVRTMIKDMIAKLEADAEAESSQKKWCDENMEEAMTARDENVAAIEGDTATITEAGAKVARLGEERTQVAEQIAQLKKGLGEATELRASERATNEETIADAESGLAGVNQAMKILKDFYNEASELQTGAKKYTPPGADAEGNTVSDLAPETFEGSFEGNQDAASGIIAQLDVIKSDFEGTISSTQDAESEAAEEYEKYKADTEKDITEKEGLSEGKEKEEKESKGTLVESKDAMKEHYRLKADALDELAKLKPTCVDTGSNYDEATARREQEIESLKNAATILDEMR